MSDLIQGHRLTLADYKFPVAEHDVFFNDLPRGIQLDPVYRNTNRYKAIVRQDNDELIAINTSTYKIVENEVLIEQLLEKLDKMDVSYNISKNDSFVTNKRMRLHLTFPDLHLDDDSEDGIGISLYLSNSYDMSEGVRLIWGAIRYVCMNGMIVGHILAKNYHRHTSGIDINEFSRELDKTYSKIPLLQDRIYMLNAQPVAKETEKKVEKLMGKTIHKEIFGGNPEQSDYIRQQIASQWVLYNMLTHYVSHRINVTQRARYQQAISKIFNL